MTNRELLAVLCENLKIGRRAVYQRAEKLKTQYPMTTEDAIYVIAQQEGIILSKYLNSGTIDRVRNLIQHVSPIKAMPSIGKATQQRKGRMEGEQRVIVIGKEFKLTDPILPLKRISEAKEMAAVYPLLYILENSIRELIDRFMISTYGNNWWESKAPKALKRTVNIRMSDEEKNSWHQRRGARPIDYLDFIQLSDLMRNIAEDFVSDIIPSLEWFTQLVNEVYKSRCVICHMNPLDADNIEAVKLRFRQWQKLINAKKGLVPQLKP